MRDENNNLVGEYFYDGEGKRVTKISYGPTVESTVFVYSSGKLVAEYSTEAPPQNPTTKYTVTDLLGSPRVLLNSLGEVASRRNFLPFGEEIAPDSQVNYRTANQQYTGDDGVRQKFTGYQKYKKTASTLPKLACTRTGTLGLLLSILYSRPVNQRTRKRSIDMSM